MHKTSTTQELGLTLTQFPQERILTCEYFPPFMIDVSVDCRSTPLNVNKQIFKKFPTYVKKHRANSQVANGNSRLPHDRFEKQGGAATPTRGDGRLIVYGITGTHNDVSSSVLDTPYVVENGKMVMETDLDLNGKSLLNYNPNQKQLFLETMTQTAALLFFLQKDHLN